MWSFFWNLLGFTSRTDAIAAIFQTDDVHDRHDHHRKQGDKARDIPLLRSGKKNFRTLVSAVTLVKELSSGQLWNALETFRSLRLDLSMLPL